MSKKRFSFYKEYPKTCRPDDFWGQVKRTINGVPVSQEQIDLIVDTIVESLELNQHDTLLDLCCGNGALSSLLFKYCKGGLGVDFSEYLISIANQHFSDPPNSSYVLKDVVKFCEDPSSPRNFSKAVCYGSFSYLEHGSAEKLLCLLNTGFPSLQRVFIGNCPDKDRMADFYGDQFVSPDVYNEPDSAIGIWRTREEFLSLAQGCGWHVSFNNMPAKYYAAHYRYDVILSR